MKKYYSVISSIVTAVVIYIAVLLNQKVSTYVAETFDGMRGMEYRALILLVVGICVGWNLWMLQKIEKNIVACIASIVISIALILVMYRCLLTGFLYPIALIGAYGFLLVSKLFCKKK